jgi:hypothetical protein
MKHNFTNTIKEVLEKCFGENSEQIFKNSELIQYLNIKTVSADRGAQNQEEVLQIYTQYTFLLKIILTMSFMKKGNTQNIILNPKWCVDVWTYTHHFSLIF